MRKKVALIAAIAMIFQLLVPFSVVFAENESDAAEEYTAQESPSVIYNMNVDWKYKRAENSATFPLKNASDAIKDAAGHNFYDVDYDDSSWATVSLPHAINADDSFDGLGKDSGESGLYRGFMFYRKAIDVPASDADKKFIIEFEAFRQSVYVYVNGTMAGYYEAGVAPVGFDLTDYIKPGEKNVIAVATDNTSWRDMTEVGSETRPGTEPGSNTGVSYQWNTKDFNEVQGGLTGNVRLYAKNKIYQTLPLYNNLKTTGNYIYASNFDFREGSADITVEAEIRNETSSDAVITLQTDIVDMQGKLVASFESKQENVALATDTDKDQFLTVVPDTAYDEGVVGTGTVDFSTVEVTKIKSTANVKNLKFWSDAAPNLYTVYTYIKEGAKVLDAQKTVTGFREVKYSKDKGLQINGSTTYLKGYAQRSTNEWAAIGVANDWLSDIDMQLIKESNANFIRWMHIAPNPVDIRAGDKYGVVSVCPAGDKEGDADGRNWDQRIETMRDVIIYFRNSPSVIFYEAGNNAISATHMRQMTELRKALDPSGGRMMGCRTINSPEQVKEAEWVGTMLYRHDANAYASMGSTNNYVPILETEYHRNEAPRRVWDDFSPPYYDYVNKYLNGGGKVDGFDVWDQTQEDFSRSMFWSGDAYSYYYNNRVGGSGKNYYSGAAMMVWSDSNMHVRNCGVENARTSGRVDPIRIKKESFYAIQAAQSSTPKIHILGHWNYPKYIPGDRENGNYWYEEKEFNGQWLVPNGNFAQRDPTKKTVYVIGSEGISKVELYVNDKLMGTDKTPDDNYIYAFDNIDVTQSGKVSAKAYNERDEVVAEHEIKTAGKAATIKLTPVTGPNGFTADGGDLAYIDVAVVDEEGNVCPLDERKISFTVSDPTKAEFIGGYNSGYYSDGLKGDGGRIVNHKDYVFAECGINRVFLRSTRDAGEFVVTASSEGMSPVSITLKSNEFNTVGGLTTTEAQSFKQGEVVQTPPPETAPALKQLGEAITADYTEETGNVITVSEDKKDYYTVAVNGKNVAFTDKPYKPDSNTGVVGELSPILDAMGVSYEFHTEGELPADLAVYGVLPWISITSGTTTITAANVSTNYIVNGEPNLANFQVIPNSTGTTLIGELSVLGSLDGVKISTDTENKVFNITVAAAEAMEAAEIFADEETQQPEAKPAAADMKYSDGKITVTANEALEKAVLIVAEYDTNGILTKTAITDVTLAKGETKTVEEAIPTEGSKKAMLWSDLAGATPIAKVTAVADNSEDEPPIETNYDPFKVYELDDVLANDDCNSEKSGFTLSDDTAPDGTKYLTAASEAKAGIGAKLTSIGYDSKEDLLWEADVRFNAEGAGITPMSEGDKKLGTCIRLKDGKLAVQKDSSTFIKYDDIDPNAWYHIELLGRFSASDARTDMALYKYEGAEKVFVNRYDGVSQRNLYANSNNGASHWNVNVGVSVDNVRIIRIAADTLTVTGEAESIKAGNVMQMSYSATRQNEYVANPKVTWEVYNADDTALLNDESITVSDGGILNVGIDAKSQTINVRATTEKGVHAATKVEVQEVNVNAVKFDTLTLTADKDYVKVGEPLTIKAAASKDGAEIAISDSDLIWYATDATDMYKLGDAPKWIKIDKGVVTVDAKAVSQDITIRAADPNDIVRGALKIHVMSSDAVEGNSEGEGDILLSSDNCEAPLDNRDLVESIDGTHAYKATAGYSTANVSETAGDIVVEMDIKFNGDGAGFQPAKSGKVNTCVIAKDGALQIQTGGSKFTRLCDIDYNAWYHLTLIRKRGSYAHIIFEKYDENGERADKQIFENVNQRNDEATAFVNINANTTYDNLRMLTPVPTDITIDTDVQTVFAGGTVQAAAKVMWKDVEMKNPDSSVFEYKIYDSENKYPLDSDKITVDGTGLVSVDAMAGVQDAYVRAIIKKSGKSASAKISILSSDIINMTKIGMSAEHANRIAELHVTKNFFYKDELTFVVVVTDADGNVKFVGSKFMYGDTLKIGENVVNLGINLPDTYDKTTDTLKIYAVTKLYADAALEAGALEAAYADGAVTLSAVPAYESGTKCTVMVLKGSADETSVTDEDILYIGAFDTIEAGASFKTAASADGYKVIVSGSMNGMIKQYMAKIEK